MKHVRIHWAVLASGWMAISAGAQETPPPGPNPPLRERIREVIVESSPQGEISSAPAQPLRRMRPGRGVMTAWGGRGPIAPPLWDGMPAGMGGLLRLPEVRKELGITDEQRRKLEEIGFNTARSSIQQQAALDVLRLELGRMKGADAPDRAGIDKKIQEIGQAEAALLRTRVNAELDVRGVLTKEQRERIAQGWEKMRGNRMEGREGPEGPMPRAPRKDRAIPLPKIPPPPER